MKCQTQIVNHGHQQIEMVWAGAGSQNSFSAFFRSIFKISFDGHINDIHSFPMTRKSELLLSNARGMGTQRDIVFSQ